MAHLHSKLNPRSEDFRANASAMRALVEDLNRQLARIAEGGGAAARAKHLGRGKLLPRERVERLLDPDTPFLEIAPLAAFGMYPERDASGNTADSAPCAGLIAGIGRVAGIECLIVCNDATVKGGTYYPLTVKKHLSAQEIAAWCGERLAAFKVPRYVVFTDDLPRTPTGKVAKHILKKDATLMARAEAVR